MSVRQRQRCSLPGETYAPALPRTPDGVVEMGYGRAEHFTRCPWGIVLTADHGAVDGWLRASWIAREFPAMLPAGSRRDPQLLEALAVIASERAAMDREEAERRASH